jgi:predicted TIM-barrel fold metal-dependent hydrolase
LASTAFTDDEKRAILGTNLATLLGLDLATVGT